MTFQEAYSKVAFRSWLSEARLRALWDSTLAVIEQGVPGAIVECGCATGGSAALLGMAAAGRRDFYLFDSFQGLPEPSERDPDRAKAQKFVGHCRGTQTQVEGFLAECGVTATIVAGMYADTLPAPEPRTVAVLHVDCDFHDAVRACLDAFYDRVSPGGRIHIDDYGHWAGCKAATDQFLAARELSPVLHRIDGTGVYLIKQDEI